MIATHISIVTRRLCQAIFSESTVRPPVKRCDSLRAVGGGQVRDRDVVVAARYPQRAGVARAGPEGFGDGRVLGAVDDHILATHTDVSELGRIAAESGVRTLVATHLSPGNPAATSDATWRRLLRDSARRADFGGRMILGEDLMRVPVGRSSGTDSR